MLACDDSVWIYAPTAQYVQTDVHSDETPNAIRLHGTDIPRLLHSVAGDAEQSSISALLKSDARLAALIETLSPDAQNEFESCLNRADEVLLPDENRAAGVEIGHAELDHCELASIRASLEAAPPVSFDIARQVQVFEPYIQFVEIHLKGCAIQRKRIEIPKSIQALREDQELETRLRTTFELIERDSSISSKQLEQKLSAIRDDFTRSLGRPWGRVILRAARGAFDERIRDFRADLSRHKKQVTSQLEEHISKSIKALVGYYSPIIRNNPPDELLGQTIGPLSDELVQQWLDSKIRAALPKAEELVAEMTLEVVFKDVTFETLNQDGFAESIRKAYPHVNWDKPFREFEAARERTPRSVDG